MAYDNYMQFPVSTLEGDLMSIKHGIKLQRHNFPHEWTAPDIQPGPQYYPGKGGGATAITFLPVSPAALRSHGPSLLHWPHQIHHQATVAEWLDRRFKYLKSGVGALRNAATRVGASRQSRQVSSRARVTSPDEGCLLRFVRSQNGGRPG